MIFLKFFEDLIKSILNKKENIINNATGFVKSARPEKSPAKKMYL